MQNSFRKFEELVFVVSGFRIPDSGVRLRILVSDSGFRFPGFRGYLPFTRENRKFQLEDQMVRAIPLGKLQKIWVLIFGDAIFLLF